MKNKELLSARGILLTDQYQLTMAQLYFRMGLHETPAQFDHFFRSTPDYGVHKAGFAVNAGLAPLVDWLDEAVFGEDEINYLRSQRSSTGDQLFKEDFLSWLKNDFSSKAISLYAMPEGRVVHPNVPIHVVEGPLAVGLDFAVRRVWALSRGRALH
ncbi:MAG: nicotinate phosphoribosyltransferase [Marinimicrobia bacterium 46_43]|nr:MAG: nicotinate phosphoribosyltransferase [Marinimicrobia bacterium 46_43]